MVINLESKIHNDRDAPNVNHAILRLKSTIKDFDKIAVIAIVNYGAWWMDSKERKFIFKSDSVTIEHGDEIFSSYFGSTAFMLPVYPQPISISPGFIVEAFIDIVSKRYRNVPCFACKNYIRCSLSCELLSSNTTSRDTVATSCWSPCQAVSVRANDKTKDKIRSGK